MAWSGLGIGLVADVLADRIVGPGGIAGAVAGAVGGRWSCAASSSQGPLFWIVGSLLAALTQRARSGSPPWSPPWASTPEHGLLGALAAVATTAAAGLAVAASGAYRDGPGAPRSARAAASSSAYRGGTRVAGCTDLAPVIVHAADEPLVLSPSLVRDDLRPLQRRLVVLADPGLVPAHLARLWLLQVLQGAYWRSQAENNRLRRVPLEAPRGIVTDVNGEVILDNRPSYQLLLFPEEMRDQHADRGVPRPHRHRRGRRGARPRRQGARAPRTCPR